MPLLIRLGSVISAYSTKQFFEYISNLEDTEQKVRRGERLTPANNIVSLAVALRDNEMVNISLNEDLEKTENNLASTASKENRFSKLNFKEKLKTKGKPKRRRKQLTFKKTHQDHSKNKRVKTSCTTPNSGRSLIQPNVNLANIDPPNKKIIHNSLPPRNCHSSFTIPNLTAEYPANKSTEIFKWPELS